jgi:S1-C subfamily serine protease
VTPELSRVLKLPAEHGVLVVQVVAQSPAAKVGIRGGSRRVRVGNTILLVGGDLIVSVDGQKVDTMNGLVAYLEDHKKVGQVVEMEVLRDGQRLKVSVTLGEAPEELS